MKYKLMIKTHNITGLKYLCITNRYDYVSYTGSGSRWIKHLKKHGYDISTELIFESDDYIEFVGICIETSNALNVALSEEFANMVPETGYNNASGKSNLVLFWEYASEEVKQDIISKRSVSIKNNHWIKSLKYEETRKNISESLIEYWEKFTLDERREKVYRMLIGNISFHENKNCEKYIAWKNAISNSMKNYCNTVDSEYMSKKNRQARLNTSPESKLRRKEKIQAVYATGKHDALFKKMSEQRKGKNNPMYGINIWKDKGEVECPHCSKKMNDSPAARRWHFDNCKNKKDI